MSVPHHQRLLHDIIPHQPTIGLIVNT